MWDSERMARATGRVGEGRQMGAYRCMHTWIGEGQSFAPSDAMRSNSTGRPHAGQTAAPQTHPPLTIHD